MNKSGTGRHKVNRTYTVTFIGIGKSSLTIKYHLLYLNGAGYLYGFEDFFYHYYDFYSDKMYDTSVTKDT